MGAPELNPWRLPALLGALLLSGVDELFGDPWFLDLMVDDDVSFMPTWGETDPTASTRGDVSGMPLKQSLLEHTVSFGTRARVLMVWALREVGWERARSVGPAAASCV